MVYKCLLENSYEEEFIIKLEKDIEREDWESWLYTLGKSEKEFLNTIIEIHIKEVEQKGSNGEIKISDLQQKLIKYSPARLSQLISSFEEFGIIQTRYINKGRGGGRYRLISFSDPQFFTKLESII
mgnify:CR=1 FL=1